MEKVCPGCGTELHESYLYCPKCGAPLDGKRECPACNRRIELDAIFCPYCGQRIDGKGTCAKCGNEIESDTLICAKCGTPVQQKQEPLLNESKHKQKSHVISPVLRAKIGFVHVCIASIAQILLLACCFNSIFTIRTPEGIRSLRVSYFFVGQFQELRSIQNVFAEIISDPSALMGTMWTQAILNAVVCAANIFVIALLLVRTVVKSFAFTRDMRKNHDLSKYLIASICSYATMIGVIRLSYGYSKHSSVSYGLGSGAVAAFTIGAIALAALYGLHIWCNYAKFSNMGVIIGVINTLIAIVFGVVSLHAISDGGYLEMTGTPITLFELITYYYKAGNSSPQAIVTSSLCIAFVVLGILTIAVSMGMTIRGLFRDKSNLAFIPMLLALVFAILYSVFAQKFVNMAYDGFVIITNSTVSASIIITLSVSHEIFIFILHRKPCKKVDWNRMLKLNS